jgi:UDP-N-acetylglucosamine 2-epimerase (non-hydrolysing)
MKKIISVVGARPNFMKVAPLHRAFQSHSHEVSHLICHTGQHYDEKMSKVFFDELELPRPDFHLGVGSGSHAEQTARVMIEFEKVLLAERPELIIVVGDVNSTIACALVAAKLGILIAHVEAGLRSFDRRMPEEINRLLTDAISDLLFVSESSGLTNLKREGIPEEKVFFVGNVMIDSLVRYLQKAEASSAAKRLGVCPSEFILVTFHRPSNVDKEEGLKGIIELLNSLASSKQVLFPMHPRTRANLEKFALTKQWNANVKIVDPIGYIDFLSLLKNAALVITDSGGIQEETTYLGVQCITVRDNTERPSTVHIGTNHLAGANLAESSRIAREILCGNKKDGRVPERWDGTAGERIAEILLSQFTTQ